MSAIKQAGLSPRPLPPLEEKMSGDIKGRVLVIDDEKGLREMLCYALPRRGYEVSAAKDGAEGLEKVRAQEFDVVLCDIMMPGMSGLETLKALKRTNAAISVVMATGCATRETDADILNQGASECIPKPYELDVLCALLDKIMMRKVGQAGE